MQGLDGLKNTHNFCQITSLSGLILIAKLIDKSVLCLHEKKLLGNESNDIWKTRKFNTRKPEIMPMVH